MIGKKLETLEKDIGNDLERRRGTRNRRTKGRRVGQRR